jgi:predicted branched-subunit amino acid permease
MTLEAGWLGKIFGSSTNAPTNIAGVVLSAFIISIFLVLLMPTRMETVEYLKLVLPVVTLVLGYLFGKST